MFWIRYYSTFHQVPEIQKFLTKLFSSLQADARCPRRSDRRPTCFPWWIGIFVITGLSKLVSESWTQAHQHRVSMIPTFWLVPAPFAAQFPTRWPVLRSFAWPLGPEPAKCMISWPSDPELGSGANGQGSNTFSRFWTFLINYNVFEQIQKNIKTNYHYFSSS